VHMLWNTQVVDTCIVFKQWHISSRFAFVLSFIAIIFMSLGYEYLRAYQRIVDHRIALMLSRGKARDKGSLAICTPVPFYPRVLRATLYGVQVFVSFFLMLVFMTYNAYLIFAVVLGASIGHFIFGAAMDVEAVLAGADLGKGMACH